MCLLAIMLAGTSAKAQEVTITLTPGWTWMSFPTADTVDFATALGDFTPMQGDVIKSQWGQATYINGQWRGGISQFYPGYGYHYKSNRTEPVSVTLNAQPNPYGGDHDYVDLGLPSGNLWATCNVGAQEPWEYGVYFAWGETLPKDSYDWFNYQYSYGANSDHPNLTKYCSDPNFGYDGFSDTLTTLLPEDDAAKARWGADWRMPTFDEWMELYQYTTLSWTIQNGVYGVRYTASNGNSIFLPAAGIYVGDFLSNAESLGDYWSSSLYTDFPGSAMHITIRSGNNYSVGSSLRYRGASVRAVRSSGQN